MYLENELKAALDAAKHAEIEIMKIYNTDFDVEIKGDESPVTAADKKADEMIREELGKKFPEIGFLTEESADTGERFNHKAIWIVDPVDGTKEFVSRNGQFTTNIALAIDHEVVLGVINAPNLGITYYAVKGEGSFKIDKDGSVKRIHVSDRDKDLRPLRSISFFKEEEKKFMEDHKDVFGCEATPIGAALKFCAIAEGSAEFFIRSSGGTKEWDVASGDIILSEAGGIMIEPSGKKFTYNRKDVYNRNGYVMANKITNTFIK